MTAYYEGSDLRFRAVLTDPDTGNPITVAPADVTFRVLAPGQTVPTTYTLSGAQVTAENASTYSIIQHVYPHGNWKWTAWSNSPRGEAAGLVVVLANPLYNAG